MKYHPLAVIIAMGNRTFQHQWSFQQDSAPSHGPKKTQEWLATNVPCFISKKEWLPTPPDLNPLDNGDFGE